MRKVPCPRCGSESLLHYTDAYVVRRPVINNEGQLELTDGRTNEYDDSFFDCEDCGYRWEGDELLLSAKRDGAIEIGLN
jgi:hypothetical protein